MFIGVACLVPHGCISLRQCFRVLAMQVPLAFRVFRVRARLCLCVGSPGVFPAKWMNAAFYKVDRIVRNVKCKKLLRHSPPPNVVVSCVFNFYLIDCSAGSRHRFVPARRPLLQLFAACERSSPSFIHSRITVYDYLIDFSDINHEKIWFRTHLHQITLLKKFQKRDQRYGVRLHFYSMVYHNFGKCNRVLRPIPLPKRFHRSYHCRGYNHTGASGGPGGGGDSARSARQVGGGCVGSAGLLYTPHGGIFDGSWKCKGESDMDM